MKYANILCPGDWRVPTQQDFMDLDILLGGTGEIRLIGPDENGWTGTGTDQKYTGTDAGTWGGARWNANASYLSGGEYSDYWSSSENSAGGACRLFYDASRGGPQNYVPKNLGFALRCVKDVP